MSQNHIKKIAMVGAGGQSGSFIAEALIKTGRFHITALTRPDSTNTMPSGIEVAKVDYNDTSSLVSALKGQDCLIITMSVFAGPDAQRKLIEAAAAADVPWILPNEWGSDHLDETVAKESLIGEPIRAARKLITDLGKSSYIAFVCSFWYEYSLTAGPWSYGFDWDNKKVTFFDQGDTPISTATWPMVGRGVAALLSLPIHKDGGSDGACLDDFRNGCCYVSSFRTSQRQIYESLMRVTGAKEGEWTVEYQDVKERYAEGMKEMQSGKRTGFGKCLYSRLFWPDAPGDNIGKGKDHRGVLGLQQEDFDARTKVAVERYQEKGHMAM